MAIDDPSGGGRVTHDEVTEVTTVAAPRQQCLDVATDFERYPEWALDVREAEVVERDDEGRAVLVSFRAAAMGHSTRYVLRYDHHQVPDRLSWRLVEGDLVRRLDGEYVFEPVEGDESATSVSYHLVVELAVPLPGFVKRRAEGRIMATALDELKRRSEHLAAS